MIVIDVKSRVPIYEQLKNKVVQLILLGVLKSDEQLPSVRTLAKDLEINPNTVSKAYQDLEKEGVVYTVAGKGCFVGDSQSLHQKARVEDLAELRRKAQGARANGVLKEDVIKIIDEVFDEEGQQ